MLLQLLLSTWRNQQLTEVCVTLVNMIFIIICNNLLIELVSLLMQLQFLI